MSEADEQRCPTGWCEAPLSSVVSHHSGDSKIIKGTLSSTAGTGLFPAFSATGQDVWRDDFSEEGDAIVVSAVGARCGKSFLASGRWSAIANTHVVWPDPRGINRRFLWYRINDETFWVRSGSAQPFLVVKASLQRPFNLPPLAEQDRIADALDELFSDLDAAVAALERAREKLKLYRASVLKAAVEGALTAEWRGQHQHTDPASELLERVLAERRRRWEEDQLAKFKAKGQEPRENWKAKYKEPVAPNTTNLPPLPEEWCWATVDQIVADSLIGLDRGMDHQRPTPPGSPYVKMNNVTMDGHVLLSDVVFVTATAEEQSRYALRADDLVFNTRNSKELVGKVGIVRQPPNDAIYNNNLMRLRLDGAVVPAFCCLQMCASEFRSRMEQVKKATTSVAAVYAKDLFPLAVAVPPLAEQGAIVEAVEDQLSVIDHLEADLDAKLKNAQGLRQAILRHAFSGQLVPQDPNDEPASELLNRIAAEREARAREVAVGRTSKATNTARSDRRGRPKSSKDQ